MYGPSYQRDYGGEQQQELLIQGHFQQPPTSVNDMADRLEAGGAKIEDALGKLNTNISVLYFITGWLVVFGGICGFIGSLRSLSPLGLLQACFVMVFGMLMVILDTPGAPRWAAKYRQAVRNHARLLTKISGKGLWYVFLGSLVAATTWPADSSRASGLTMLMSILLAMTIIVAGGAGMFIGFRRSLILEKVRKQIQNEYKGNTAEVYRKYAVTDPAHGMVPDELCRMCADFTQGRVQFNIHDQALVLNSLDEHQKGAINEQEFLQWMGGAMTYL